VLTPGSRAGNARFIGAIDFGRGEEKRRAGFEHPRGARKRGGLIAARKVKHHPPRNRRVETGVSERTVADVAAHHRRARKVDPKAREHAGGRVETHHAMAGALR